MSGDEIPNQRVVTSITVENPAVPLSAGADALGDETASGVRVTPERALGYPAVWRAVNLISGDVAKLPLRVYRMQGTGKTPAPEHPAYRLLYRKPNEFTSAFVFKQTLQAFALIHGNGCAYIDRNPDATPKALLILPPKSCRPFRAGGRLWYAYQTPDGEPRKLPAMDVLHIRGLTGDGLEGYDPIRIARESLGAALAGRDFGARYFQNDARPGGVIEHPGTLTDAARENMRRSWMRLHSGLENRHKVAIMEEGSKYHPLSPSARDSQLLELREFDAREIANLFGVPTHKLGDPSKVAYNSLDAENQSYYDDTLSRWLEQWAQECEDKLLSEAEKEEGEYDCGFEYAAIQRANLSAQTVFVTSLVNSKLMCPDEGRAVFGLNPLPDGAGSWGAIIEKPEPEPAPAPEPPVPNPDPVEDPESDPPEDQPDPQAARSGLAGVLADVVGRMARRLGTASDRVGFGPQRAGKLATHRPVIAEALGPVLTLARALGAKTEAAEELAGFMLQTVTEAGAEEVENVVRELPAALAERVLGGVQ